MEYTVSLLTTAADCQALINLANQEKEILDHRRVGMEIQRKSSATNSVSIEAELAAVTAEIDAYNSVIASLPDGPVKEENRRKLIKSEYKKFLLEQRRENYGVLAVLEKEYDIACLEKDLEETDAFIAALQAQMNTF